MIPCNVKELCTAIGGVLLQDSDACVTGITTDSRKVGAGELFIPLVGEKFDGHAYIESALEAGAVGCLTARVPEKLLPGKCYIKVEDTLLALKKLASWYRGRFDLPVVQITGSAGKTTTKEMIASVVSQKYKTLKTQANFNNHIGTPQTLLGLMPEHEAAVIETGMNHFGEIRYLGEMVRPNIAVITNVGDAHIENLGGTRQGTLKAKSEIFENLQPGGLAVLNGDDELLCSLHLSFETVLCGLNEGCTVRVSNVCERGIEGITCTVITPRDCYDVTIPSPGAYMIYPASMAIAVGEKLGLTKEEILRGIAAYQPVGSRMHLIRGSEGRVIIDDCYNANPQAMAEAIRILGQTPCRRRVAVLGDMGELGELTAQAHRDMGECTNRSGIDVVVAIGPKAKSITEMAKGEVYWFQTKEDAYDTLCRQFTPGTAVLVKASHAMEFGKIVEKMEIVKDL
ncbi:MAG: UDP-N-acetylmuramoyl-tripeptide--D-alanyl-D-alanine ligase [Clostridiales bacterium]|nr:UDP-N-acetylmuramoyl-tripeptide--D-alanyl-D-alanine ligase [Candidatus Cacconaster stercorequi]